MKASEIQIPEPCDADWEAMTPIERGRFCADCQKKVHDLSAMPERDARAFLESDDDICISYLSNADGEVRFQPSRIVPLHRLARRASMATAAGLSLALAACAPHGDDPQLEETKETERPAFLEFEPTIPDAEPCETQPPPELVPPAVARPESVRVRGRGMPTRKKERVRRTGGAKRSSPDPLEGL